MTIKVTKKGALIPKDILKGIKEVENRKANGMIIIVPVGKDDPIFELGKYPVACGVQNGSEHHDRYIYHIS